MAIIRTGPIVSDISGSLGSVVFVAGAASTVARPRPNKLFHSSPSLQRARSFISNVRRTWSTLTALQQDAWRTSASDINSTNALGQSSPMSGFNLFVKVNTELIQSTDPIRLTPPINGVHPVPINPAATFSDAGAYTISADALPGFPNTFWFVYGWPFWTDHDSRDKARLVYLRTVITPGLTVNVKLEWTARFGALRETQRFAAGVAMTRVNFARSAIVILRDTVAA